MARSVSFAVFPTSFQFLVVPRGKDTFPSDRLQQEPLGRPASAVRQSQRRATCVQQTEQLLHTHGAPRGEGGAESSSLVITFLLRNSFSSLQGPRETACLTVITRHSRRLIYAISSACTLTPMSVPLAGWRSYIINLPVTSATGGGGMGGLCQSGQGDHSRSLWGSW